jgi:hypothetical protein
MEFKIQFLELIALASLAFTLVHIVRYAEPIKRFFKLRRLKPFDCETCTGFWLGFFYSYQLPILQMILTGSIVCVLTILITKYTK